jgi:hypothetical protein
MLLIVLTKPIISEEILQERVLRPEAHLVHLGKVNGFSASNEEIVNRLKIEECLNGENNIESEFIKQKVIEEKFVSSLATVEPSYVQKQSLFDSLFRQSKCNLKFAETALYLEYLCKVSNPETYYKILYQIEKYKAEDINTEDAAVLIKKTFTPSDSVPLYRQFWNKKEFILNGYDSDCVAYDTSQQKCILTLKEFNEFVYQSVEESKNLSKDTVVELIKERILKNSYLQSKAIESCFSELDEIKDRIANQLGASRAACLAEKAQNISLLKTIYTQLYNKLYAAQIVRKIDLIGSTDSAYIKSIYEQITALDNKPSGDSSATKNPECSVSFPWNRIDVNKLPQELVISIDTLLISEISSIIKTDYGFFIAKLAESSIKREVSFEDAQNGIAAMVIDGHISPKGKVTAKEALNYYNFNKENFRKNDTLELKFALTANHYKCDNNYKQKKIFKTINSHLLPDVILSELKKKYSLNYIPKEQINFLTELGNCTVEIIDIRRGDKIKEFLEVKEQIIQQISIKTMDTECIPQQVFMDRKSSQFLAALYLNHLLTNIEEPDSEQLTKFEAQYFTEKNNPTEKGEHYQREMSRMYKNYQVEKEVKNWQKNISWNEEILWQIQ